MKIHGKIKHLPLLLILSLIVSNNVFAQSYTGPSTINRGRLNTVIITQTVVSSIAMTALYQLWYKKFPKSRFHLFNDNAEWMGMDKLGHATTAYNVSSIQYNVMRWTGVRNNQAAVIGGLTALTFQTIVEIFDGFSKHWGFSTGDMLANMSGATLFLAQQLVWKEQRVQLNFSFHKTIFSQYNPHELGENKWQRWLKDYNGQTYWLSVNPSTFFKNAGLPYWTTINLGIGATGMTAGMANPDSIDGRPVPKFERKRRLLLSAGVDQGKLLRSYKGFPFQAITGVIKVPAPAVEFIKDSTKFHFIYF